MSARRIAVTMPVRPEEGPQREARRRANARIAFFGHVLIWATTSFFLLVVAGFFPAVVVALAWGIGVVAHGFFGVLAHELRRRWTEGEALTQVAERRAVGGRHARSLEQLSASIAHEIRQPVTAAKSLVQQMGEDPSSPENVEYARVALDELDRVERSIAHLLRYAREEELVLGLVRLSEVVDAALDVLRERLRGGSVTVTRDDDPEAGELSADRDKLRQVVINLVGNALEAVGPGGTIAVATGRNLAGSEVWLRVRDDGPGIAPEKLPTIFDPFTTTKGDGTGLGLAITRKIVEAHGGRVEAGPAPGRGTEMVVTLPRAAAGAR
jgi:signal transduction histidine kinase